MKTLNSNSFDANKLFVLLTKDASLDEKTQNDLKNRLNDFSKDRMFSILIHFLEKSPHEIFPQKTFACFQIALYDENNYATFLPEEFDISLFVQKSLPNYLMFNGFKIEKMFGDQFFDFLFDQNLSDADVENFTQMLKNYIDNALELL